MEINDILARLKPGAATETDLYVAPTRSRVRLLGFTACNESGGSDALRFSVSPAGAATAVQDYLYYDLPIVGHDTFMSELEVTVNPGDAVRVRSLNGNVNFILYGQDQ